MFIVTNRGIKSQRGSASSVFKDTPNTKGPNELRVAEVSIKSGRWEVELLADRITKTESKALIKKYNLELNPKGQYYRDLAVACELMQRARDEKKNILIFVHGYNNDVNDVLTRAHELEKRYKVIVLPFSWPANGGGIKGLVSYKDDKKDAMTSTGALDRFLSFVNKNLLLLTQNNLKILYTEAHKKHPLDSEKRDILYARLVEKSCPFTVNLMTHSMGNYIFKQVMRSSISQGTGLMFHNIIMVAADTNNQGHAQWVDKMRFHKRLYLTINENDRALAASRMKSGQDQLSRLGHKLSGLNAVNAHYVNFTGASNVGSSHAYFEGDAASRDSVIQQFFMRAFNGKPADELLDYQADKNCYRLIE